ncbi:tetratricopeptide repeat protein [Microbacterium sp. UFMG61]|uniref:tetratricopeptide repeat protein n=1 Tax=Microbacterium sp. UFMG61 TaxID=2745935 RepID=UPI00188F8B47|nr:tetratricopeptide repeat protein [Microbacterium sp. UFMG61]
MTDISPAALRGAVDLSTLRNRPSAPPAGAPAAGGAVPDLVIDATDESFGQILEISRTVPVVVDLWAEWCGPCKQLSPIIEKVTRELGGKVLLAKVDVDANPQLAQGFRAQSIPMVVALIAGQPVPMFTGAVPEQQVREVFAQLLQLAAQNGVTGTVPVAGDDGSAEADAAPAEPPMPPLHAEAFAAIEIGDYAAAIVAYEKALAENPRDEDAIAGLGQVRLLDRVQQLDLQEARAAAAAAPLDPEAQFAVADLDLAGGHVDDAFGRLLDLFAQLPSDQRTPVRERLIELFGVIGAADPRVISARNRLSSLLF